MMLSAFGGNAALVNTGEFQSWIDTVHLDPVPLDAKFTKLSELIADPAKRANVESAISDYLSVSPMKGLPQCATGIGPLVNGTQTPSSLMDAEADSSAVSRRRQQQVLSPGEKMDAASALPGLQSSPLGHGFDVRTGEVKLPVAAATSTFDMGKTWYDALNKKTYSIPDGIDFLSTPSACFLEDQSIIRNESSAWNYFEKNSGFNVGVAYAGVRAGVSYTKDMSQMRARLDNYSKTIGITHRWMTVYSASIGNKYENQNVMFLKQVDALPQSYGDGRAYAEFIKYWGTHIVTGADFGGTCNFTTTFVSSKEATHSEDYVRKQIGLVVGLQMQTWGIDLDLGFGRSKDTEKVDSDFSRNSNSDTLCTGGNPNLLDGTTDGYHAWSTSLRMQPSLIDRSLRFRPISEVIGGQEMFQVKANLKRAIGEYLRK